MSALSPSDPRFLALTRLRHPRDVIVEVTSCCEPLSIPYVYEDPAGPRHRSFKYITRPLEAGQYERALLAVLEFNEQFGRFSPDEVHELTSIGEDREDALNEHAQSIQECHVLIAYESMALRAPNLSDAQRTTITQRLNGVRSTLDHDMESFTQMNRDLGTIGAIILDQRRVHYFIYFTPSLLIFRSETVRTNC